MNKLIRELAIQANTQTTSLMIMEYSNFESHLYEIFAKLVAQKCVNICENSGPNDDIKYTIKNIQREFGLDQ